MARVLSRLPSGTAVPAVYRSNFWHLYLDIAWYGVLSGSALTFVGVYATRQGAAAWQIGLLNAGPAIIGLLFTLPMGQWLKHQPINRSVFWTAVLHRFFYLFWVFLPVWFLPQGQVWALILFTLLMSIPGTGLAIGFNALFAAAVPAEWRSHVAGGRNALLALMFIVISLLCGWLLDYLPSPLGYQVVFGIGFLGAVLSTVHLWFVRPLDGNTDGLSLRLRNLTAPGLMRTLSDGLRTAVGLRFLLRGSSIRQMLRLNVLEGAYGQLILALFAFHLAQYLAIPLFPLFWVNQLHLTDQHIGWGTALFYVSVLLGSTQLARLVGRFGNHHMMVVGAVMMAAYPLLTAVTHALPLFLITSIFGGLAWSLVGGVIANYLLEKIPEHDRPSHLAWYNLALNGAVLLGSLLGPLLSGWLGIPLTLMLAAICRLGAAVALWRRG